MVVVHPLLAQGQRAHRLVQSRERVFKTAKTMPELQRVDLRVVQLWGRDRTSYLNELVNLFCGKGNQGLGRRFPPPPHHGLCVWIHFCVWRVAARVFLASLPPERKVAPTGCSARERHTVTAQAVARALSRCPCAGLCYVERGEEAPCPCPLPRSPITRTGHTQHRNGRGPPPRLITTSPTLLG